MRQILRRSGQNICIKDIAKNIPNFAAWTDINMSSELRTSEEFLTVHTDCRSLWKPLKGPITQWPLMLCDWQTYEPETDSIARDIVFSHEAIESYMIFHNPGHRFYYISEQKPHEAWIMVQSDSSHRKG